MTDSQRWIPVEAREAAEKFRLALRCDGNSGPASTAMVRAIVDHARAVRIRCDASAALVRRSVLSEVRVSLHDIAKFTADMTRRDLPTMPQTAIGERVNDMCRIVPAMYAGQGRDGIGQVATDAGHDLLMTLVCDVDVEADRGR